VEEALRRLFDAFEFASSVVDAVDALSFLFKALAFLFHLLEVLSVFLC
jgi:hypothetical protein